MNGNAIWEPNGRLIYRRDISSTITYGLSVDPDGNAIVGIDAGLSALHAPGGPALGFKVSPAGEALWGSTGITLSPLDVAVSTVLCCGTSDGGSVFTWGKTEQRDVINFIKLDAKGNQMWATSVTRDTPDAALTPMNLIASDNGSVIHAYIHNINAISGTYNSVFTQKLAAGDGANLWGETPVPVIDSSTVTKVTLPMGVVPILLSDGAGGAVFGYSLTNARQRIYVQRVNSSGQTLYAPNGVPVSGTLIEGSAARVGFDAGSGTTYILWTADYPDHVSQTDVSGVLAQCIDSAGALLWDTAGVPLTPYEPNDLGMAPVAMLPVAGGVMAAWIQLPPDAAVLPQTLRVSLLDPSGAPVWQNQVVDLKSAATTTTNNVVGTVGASGYGAFAWTSSDHTVRAQNINLDGTLGVET